MAARISGFVLAEGLCKVNAIKTFLMVFRSHDAAKAIACGQATGAGGVRRRHVGQDFLCPGQS